MSAATTTMSPWDQAAADYSNLSATHTPAQRGDDDSELLIDAIELVINCFLIHIIAAVGSACNIITVLVLLKAGTSDTNTIILLSLAVCDLVFLLTLMVRKMDCVIARFDPVSAVNYLAYMTVYVTAASRMAMLISSGHIVVISVERFIAVMFPFKAKTLCSRGRVLAVVLGQYVAMLISGGPILGYCTLEWSFDAKLNVTVATAQYSKFYLDHFDGLQFFNSIGLGIVRGSVSYLIVIICCGAVVYRLRQVSVQRLGMAAKPGRQVDVKVSRMLLAVCVVFVITNVATFAVFLYSYQTEEANLISRLFYFLINIEEALFALNSSANFFIYIFMSSKFYKTFWSLFSCAS
ncbi:FMRFamide receptor-like [Aplysia californica]|uniref:FMRFamide receptor-like n=1 Tax=Aplysia californica TaxID=6500 RepID=A0ABM0K686_APLCA|nr:FMRFamide receptor-like [Aplysia californica]